MKICLYKMINYLKNELKHLPFVIIVFILCYGMVVLADSYALSSMEVSFDNTGTNIQATNMQSAINEVYQHATDYTSINTRLTAVESKLYPVGSIYISVDSTNPSILFGGTWVAFGTGKTLVGIDTNDTDFDTVEETGGAKIVTLETANLPSHTHTVTAAGSVGAHTHTTTDYYANTNSGSTTINFSNGAAKIVLGNGYVATSEKSIGSWTRNYQITGSWTGTSGSGNHSYGAELTGSQAHTHTVSNTSATRDSGSATPTFTGTSTNTSSVGSVTPTAVNTKDPYITVYMWKRTA